MTLKEERHIQPGMNDNTEIQLFYYFLFPIRV